MSASRPVDYRDYLDCAQLRTWDIVVADEAIPSEKYAAEEFQRWFSQATGTQLPLRSTAGETACHVYIGPNAANLNPSTMGEEELCITIEKDRVAIAGGRPRGTLYGVYQFLEDYLGVRFLTYDHTHVPDASALKIPCGTHTYIPPFSFRWSFYRENAEHPEFAAKLRVNTVTGEDRLGGNTGQSLINHSFHRLVPYKEYGASHPEYYALVDGERDTRTHGAGPQLCVTNPEVVDIAASAAIKALNDDPNAQNISVSQADTDAYCRCDACAQINEHEGSPMGAQLRFVNAVAERTEEVHPDVKIGTLAYWYTRKPPATIRPRHNVQIQLCSIECCTLHPIDDSDCEKNRAFCRDVDEWGKISDDIWIWNYNTNFRAYDLPFPNLRVIGPNVRYFLHNNAKGVFMQANGNGTTGELCDLRNYIIGRLIWNPDLDDKVLCGEFVGLHYKGAAQPILDYINALHENAEARGVHPGCFPSPQEVGLDAEYARKVFDYFEQALVMADDDVVRARVEKASICAYKAMIVTGDEMEPVERSKLIDRYIDLCQRYQMTHASENKLASDYFEELKPSLE